MKPHTASRPRWAFVTAPFILFTGYTFLLSSSMPDQPQRVPWLVAGFSVGIALLLVVQMLLRDRNYFVPTMALVCLVMLGITGSLRTDSPLRLHDAAPAALLLLERPQLLLYAGLMLMALLPPLLWTGSFTAYFSRAEYPAEEWHTPAFTRINRHASHFWVAVFGLCLLTQFVPSLVVQLVAPIVIVLTLGAWGTRRLVATLIEREYTDEA